MKYRRRNTIGVLILFSLILLLTGCSCVRETRPIARYQELVSATITQINKSSWYAKTRHYQTQVWITDDKYGATAYFQSYTKGLFYLPKYWDYKKGDKITVIANVEYYIENNQIVRIWLQEIK